MKKVEVTSCSHSHGAPMVRVTMSQTTEVQKPISVAPHSTISSDSSQSSAGHFNLRCRCRTSERSSAITLLRRPARMALLHRADQLLDLRGMRPEVLGHLLEIGRGHSDEARFVDVGHDLDTHALELGRRLMLEVEGTRRLDLGDLVSRRLHPALLLGRQARPRFVADRA